MLRLSLFMAVILTAGAAAIDARVAGQSRRGWQRVKPEVADAPLDGSLPALLRARLLATRALVAMPRSGDLLVDSAFVEALLAHDYGLPSEQVAEGALGRATSTIAAPAAPDVAVLATRGLLALVRGDAALALELSRTAAEAERTDARPLLVLGRAHLASGDLRAASAVFEAAMARAPGAAGPLVGWAEAQLGLGAAAGPPGALAEALRRSPQHTRALLLWEEVAQLGTGPGASAAAQKRKAACAKEEQVSPALAASCALAGAVQARLRGDRQAALAMARASVETAERPAVRDLALGTILLTHLGEVAAADRALGRLRGTALAGHPLLAWAQVSVASSRGEPPPRALPPYPQHPETRLAAAREALAEGGAEAITAFLQDLTDPAIATDPDLRILARLRVRADRAPEPLAEPPAEGASLPQFAYVEGLRAQMAGDVPLAARWLARALGQHADACRAVGHYLPALALRGQPPADELEPLRGSNPRCRELRWTDPSTPENTAVEVASPSDAPATRSATP